ncbi:hypothetical protein ACWENO_07200 [Streptomyces sp. NPDC004436]
MLSQASEPDTATRKPLRQRTGLLVSAAVVLSLLAGGGAVLLVQDDASGDGESRAAAPAAAGTTAAPAPVSSAPAAAEQAGQASGTGEGRPPGCRTDDTDQAVPTSSPADLKWMIYQTDLLPASPTAGPLKVDGPVWSCFARTPLGAVLALHAVSSRMSSADWKVVTEKQVARGPGRDAFVARRTGLPDEERTGTPGSDGNFLGFRILTASKDQVTTMLLLQTQDGKYGAVSASMVWEDGDWKLRPTLSGSLTESITQTGGTEGFVLWAAGRKP